MAELGRTPIRATGQVLDGKHGVALMSMVARPIVRVCLYIFALCFLYAFAFVSSHYAFAMHLQHIKLHGEGIQWVQPGRRARPCVVASVPGLTRIGRVVIALPTSSDARSEIEGALFVAFGRPCSGRCINLQV